MAQSPGNSPLLAALTEDERAEAMARYRVIAPLLDPAGATPDAWSTAVTAGHCSRKTLQRWMDRFRSNGLAGLARRRRADQGQRRVVSADLQRTIEALYLENRYRSVRTVYRLAAAYATEQGLRAPSYAVVRQICQAIPPAVVCLAHEGEQAWRARFEPISHHESPAPNARWQIDHCKLDVLVIDPRDGTVQGRPWLTVVLDGFSRAVMGYHLSLDTPTSQTVCLALRQAIWPKGLPEWPMCGLPQELHLDNGKDFGSHHLEQVAADLGITVLFATPYLARAKGKIERFFRTLNEQVWCELPGYVGPNVAERPTDVAPMLTLQQVDAVLLAFLLTDYHRRSHAATEAPPLERWQQPGWAPTLPPSLRQLDLLLLPQSGRLVQRDGIHLHHLCYWHDALAPHIGQRVQVRYDPLNVAAVIVYAQQAYLCTAVAPALHGLEISLRDWHALQTQQRRSVREVVRGYQDFLAEKRAGPFPSALSVTEVDALILLQRLEEASVPPRLRLFASEVAQGSCLVGPTSALMIDAGTCPARQIADVTMGEQGNA